MYRADEPERAGVLSQRQMKRMIASGGISYVKSYCSDFSPTMMSLLLTGNGTENKESFVLERGEERDFDLNVATGTVRRGLHFIADGKTTTARIGLSVDVIDADGCKLPYQPSSDYPADVSPHPKAGVLRARIKATQFPVILWPGNPVANLRVFYGEPEESLMDPLSRGEFLYVDGKTVPLSELQTRKGRYLEMHLNLKSPVHNGATGYVSLDNSTGKIRHEKGANNPSKFYASITADETWTANPDTLSLLYTLEELDLTGGGVREPCIGFMRRRINGSDAINFATMLEPELPKRLAIEIQPRGREMKLHHGQYICDVDLYRGCETLDIKTHNSGNRHPFGKLFKSYGNCATA
jgi:hypothetical protein